MELGYNKGGAIDTAGVTMAIPVCERGAGVPDH